MAVVTAVGRFQGNFFEIERRQAEITKRKSDIDEFIRRLKTYMQIPKLTREMCVELIEFVTVDKRSGRYSKEPREIHIYYKLLDKAQPPEKIYANDQTCENC